MGRSGEAETDRQGIREADAGTARGGQAEEDGAAARAWQRWGRAGGTGWETERAMAVESKE